VLRAEALEDRLLPSLTPSLLLNINSSGSSNPKFFTQVGSSVFFQADDGIHGAEPWASNGTAAGTVLVKDINGSGGSNPTQFTNVNGTAFFQANDGIHGQELWASNGTTGGTFLVDDIYPGNNGSNPNYLTNVNGTLFFAANDGSHGTELWKSDGTPAGTVLVKDIFSGAVGFGSNPTDLTNVNGTLFFQANDGITDGAELWKSNGTASGTVLVKDIFPGEFGSYPTQITNVNGTAFFQANDGLHGQELWASNGTTGGTFLVDDIYPGMHGSNPMTPTSPTNVSGTLFFSANDGAHGIELWESNGSSAGTFLVKDIAAGSSYPVFLTNVNGTLFFDAFDESHGRELWASNGSSAGTFLVADIISGAPSSNPSYLTSVNGTLFFQANDATHGRELWASNGTASGTFLVADIDPGNVGSYPQGLTNVHGTLFFQANDGTNGAEPWELVVPATTTTAVTSSPNPSAFGQAVTITGAVGTPAGSPTPTGTVDFKEGATDLTPGGISLIGNQATFSTASLAVGSHTITGIYSGDSTFVGSQGNDSASPQVVQKDSTSVNLIVGPSTLVSGQSAAFVAVVANTSGPFGTPTGKVQFAVDGTNVGSPVTLVGGVAPLPTRLLAAGSPHTITATYTNSDGDFLGSSKLVTQAVAKAGTKTILLSTPTTAVAGQVVVFSAIVNPVAPGTGTPTGLVDFKEGATDLTPGGVTMTGGRATFSTSSLGLGTHTITATYGGDANFTGSSGNDASAPVVVNKASSRTVVTSFPDPSVFGQVVSFTVAVIALAPSQGTPTGSVIFTDGATPIGTVTVNNVGRATFTTASLSRGNHAINANYGGDGKFLASANSNFGETVQKAATTTAVTTSVNPVVLGQTLTITAIVQAASPGAGTPTGMVTFMDNTTVLGTGTLNAAHQATFTTTSLALGSHALTSAYAGDNNFTSSFAPNFAETVKSMAGTTTIASATSAKGTVAVSTALLGPVSPTPGTVPLAASRLDAYFASKKIWGTPARTLAGALARPRAAGDSLGGP
jgi:ELWxxDGT repeat protein